jgi:hypothetical protein
MTISQPSLDTLLKLNDRSPSPFRERGSGGEVHSRLPPHLPSPQAGGISFCEMEFGAEGRSLSPLP